MTTDLANPLTLEEIEESRNKSIELYRESLKIKNDSSVQMSKTLGMVSGAKVSNYSSRLSFENIYDRDEDLINKFTSQIDSMIWNSVYTRLNMSDIMDAKARKEYSEGISGDNIPPATADNIRATVDNLQGDSFAIFQRGLVNAFSQLDRRFKSHDGFKLGSRIIFKSAFSEWGGSYRAGDLINDVERVFFTLDGKTRDDSIGEDGKVIKFNSAYNIMRRAKNWEAMDTPYFRGRRFQNGNLHLWFKDDSLVRKANLLLADYYGEQIGQGSEVCDPSEMGPEFLPTVHKELGYYPTPDDVIERMLQAGKWMDEGDKILEPSCGDGAILDYIKNSQHSKNKDLRVTAYEYDKKRSDIARAKGHYAINKDFLSVPPPSSEDSKFDRIYMNPPFNKGRDIDHVTHALKFLKVGGILVSVMSARAELSHNSRHVAFRKMVNKGFEPTRSTYWKRNEKEWFTDLPEGSFKSAGTNVNTVIFAAKKV